MPEPARPVVCSFESRRAAEMASLIERHGGEPRSAPSMREVPIEDNPAAIEFVRQVVAGEFPYLILLTGVGTEALFEVARSQNLFEPLLAALKTRSLIIRGPKPAAVLAKAGLTASIRAPEPNTWRELVSAIDAARIPLAGQKVAVQEYGLPNARLYDELRSRGADVTAVPVYRWALPDDPAPLEAALREIAAGNVDVVLFTSANQISNVFAVAESLKLNDEVRQALATDTLVASIGPTCSEALADNGLPIHFAASPPKMGPLVRGAIEAWQARRG